MADWAKKIGKHCGEALYAGEVVEAGTFVQPGGTLKKQVAFGAIGGVVGAIAAEKLGKKDEEPVAAGQAAGFPKTRAVLGLSSQRLLVFSHGTASGKPKDLVYTVPLHDVAAVATEKNKISYTLRLTFKDGSSVEYESVKAAKPVEFAEAFQRLSA